MKFVLFCQNPYAFGIMEPLVEVLEERRHDYLWYLSPSLKERFPWKSQPSTSSMADLKSYRPDAILCPGNEVPHYLRGLKVQIFHGLAGEKKGHFRIRHYFDLYLTQGPYFTDGFLELQKKHRDFEVLETGWPKLDIYGKDRNKYDAEKQELLHAHQAETLLLYAPTFSPSLTSAPYLLEEIKTLATDKTYLLLIKFHDLMASEVVEQYKNLAADHSNIRVEEEPNIVKYLLMADVMISDTSSVVYEFLLLDKPVITFRNNSENIRWEDSQDYSGLQALVAENLEKDPYQQQRQEVIESYHPYSDGRSAVRMITAIENFISEHGVPEKRKLPFLRRLKMNRKFK